MVSRHSAFYSPLIAAIAGGFLEREGLEATYSVLGPGQRSHVLIRGGEVDVMQSAVSSNWKPRERGEAPLPVHFAQINCRDGFFLVAREPDPDFAWTKLEGRALAADHGLQPVVMLRYAVRHNGAKWSKIAVVDAGTPEEMAAAFRAGTGDYVHLQGPAAQQIVQEGAGHIVASVGAAMPPVAFSSLCASRAFLETPASEGFLRAFAAAKEWTRSAPPAEVATAEASFFPGIAREALVNAIRAYQQLGCWDGGIGIPAGLYAQALNVFEQAGEIRERHAF